MVKQYNNFMYWMIDMLSKEELIFIKKHLNFWDNLCETEKELMANKITVLSYDKGYNLNNPDECLGLLLIKKGELRVYILSEEGREVTLYRLTQGETCVLSASCLINNITFDVHIKAEADTKAFILDTATLSKLSEQNVYVENFTYKKTIERFSDVMWAVEQILFMTFDKRLAIFLLDEMAKNKSTEITLTQEQIAKYIGSAREVVSRMLKSFQSQGIVELERGKIQVKDPKKLKEIIG